MYAAVYMLYKNLDKKRLLVQRKFVRYLVKPTPDPGLNDKTAMLVLTKERISEI